MSMLRRLKQLSPQLDGLKDRINSIGEELMQENADDFELDTRKSWEHVGDVLEGKSFRIAATGNYKMTMIATVSVDGIKPDKESKDHLPRCATGLPAGRDRERRRKAGAPFSREIPVGNVAKEERETISEGQCFPTERGVLASSKFM